MRLLPLVLVVTLGCGAFDPGDPLPTIRVTPPDDVVLVEGQSAEVSLPGGGPLSLTVRFVEVTSDSRCPDFALCIWEGDAAVRLELSGEATGAVTLHTPTEQIGPRAGAAGRYWIELIHLSRLDPVRTQRSRPDSYHATLRITVPTGG